jgi:hypothetical protein
MKMNIKIAVIAALFAASPFAAGDTLHLPNHGEGTSNSTEVVHAIHVYTIQSHTFTSATVQTGNIQAGGLKAYQVSAKVGYIHHLNSAGIMNNGAQITSVGAGTVGTDAANVNQLNAVQAKASAGIASANSNATTGDTTTLNRANADSRIMASSAQSNSYAYTNRQASATLGQANSNAQGYANRAQNNAEQFAQGAANRAQMQSDHYAASGIAAALAIPSSPYLRPGHYALGVQGGFYGGMSAVGGLSSGTGRYSNYAETVGLQWEN